MSKAHISIIERLLPPNFEARRLLVTVMIQALGFGMLTTMSAIYYTQVLGFSATQVGVGLSIATFLGLTIGVPFGHLADRRGPRGLLIFLLASQGLAVLSYLFIHSWASFLVILSLYQLVDRAASAVRGALVAKLIPASEQAVTRSYFRAVSNIGIAIGTSLVGGAMYLDTARPYDGLIILASVGYGLASLSLCVCTSVPPVPKERRASPTAALRDQRYLAFSLLNVGLTFHYAVLEIGMPLWIVQQTRVPKFMVTVMFLLNTTLVTSLQVFVGKSAGALAGAKRATLVSGVLLAASCLLFGLSSQAVTGLIAVFCLLTAGLFHALGEMYQTAGAWTLAFDLAPSNAHGQYQGLFSTSTSAGLMLGSSAVTLLVLHNGLSGWLLLGAIFFLSAAGTAYLVSQTERRRVEESDYSPGTSARTTSSSTL
jgi:MFS family permease